jgi:hypothetical protein
MKDIIKRRRFIAAAGAGAVCACRVAAGYGVEKAETKLALDRTGVVWGDRPMYLRPYHPPYVVYYYGARNERKTVKWDPLITRVENEPNLKIRIVESFDDACAGCAGLTPDRLGSVWGVGHTCSSAKNPETVAMVTRTNRRILNELGLDFGSEILFRDIVPLLAKNVPVLYEGIGGPDNQALYVKGLKDLKEKYRL